MNKLAQFTAVTIAVCCVGAWIITLAVPGQDVSRSVWASAGLVVDRGRSGDSHRVIDRRVADPNRVEERWAR